MVTKVSVGTVGEEEGGILFGREANFLNNNKKKLNTVNEKSYNKQINNIK